MRLRGVSWKKSLSSLGVPVSIFTPSKSFTTLPPKGLSRREICSCDSPSQSPLNDCPLPLGETSKLFHQTPLTAPTFFLGVMADHLSHVSYILCATLLKVPQKSALSGTVVTLPVPVLLPGKGPSLPSSSPGGIFTAPLRISSTFLGSTL